MDLRIKNEIDFGISDREKIVLRAVVDRPGSTIDELAAVLPKFTKKPIYVIRAALTALEARRLIERRKVRRVRMDGSSHAFVEVQPTVKGVREVRGS